MDSETQDIVSLQDIGQRIWARRGLITSLVLLTGLAAGAVGVFQLGFSGEDVVSFIDLKGIEKGQYPGGATFSTNDLQRPEVLRAALEVLELPTASLDEIADGLLVEYGSPGTAWIVRKHRERLAVKGLSTAEIDSRNAEFREELEDATHSSIRLALNPSVEGLGVGTTIRLLQEIPAQWTRIYSERYRIFEAPGLEGETVSLEPGPLTDPSVVIAAIKALNVLKRGLDAIAGDNRVNYLVNSSAHTASEIRGRLDVFEAIRFRPLSQALLSRPGPVTDSYRQDLRLKVQYLQAQIAGYDRITEELSTGRDGAAAEWVERGESSAVNQLQLSGDSLGTIIGLAERASNAEFVREILLERLAIGREMAQTEVLLARVETVTQFRPSQELVTVTEEQLTRLAREYEDLYTIAIERLRVDLGTLYSVLVTPTRTRAIELTAVVLRAFGAVLAALFLGVLIALLLPNSRGSKRETAGVQRDPDLPARVERVG